MLKVGRKMKNPELRNEPETMKNTEVKNIYIYILLLLYYIVASFGLKRNLAESSYPVGSRMEEPDVF